MQIGFQVLLLCTVITTPIVAAIRFRTGPARSLSDISSALGPYLLLAIPSALLAQESKPFVEWFLPALAAMVLAIFCKHEKKYRILWWATFVAAIILCVNFLSLDGGDYCRGKQLIQRVNTARTIDLQRQGKEALKNKFAAAAVMPPGPVSKLLNAPVFDEAEIVTFKTEWHSPLTGLFHVKKEKAILWYPGGRMDEASERLELRVLE